MRGRVLQSVTTVTAAVALVLVALLMTACERKDPYASQGSARSAEQDFVPPPSVKPEYSFAPGLREEFPHVIGFVRQFLETCLAGDYGGYRLLASRRREPESRERFQAVYHAIQSLQVTGIERKEIPDLSPDVYLVTCHVEFQPEAKVELRRKTNDVAILVLKEDREWRFLPAPAELQPRRAADDAAQSAPSTAPAPSYPWDAQEAP